MIDKNRKLADRLFWRPKLRARPGPARLVMI